MASFVEMEECLYLIIIISLSSLSFESEEEFCCMAKGRKYKINESRSREKEIKFSNSNLQNMNRQFIQIKMFWTKKEIHKFNYHRIIINIDTFAKEQTVLFFSFSLESKIFKMKYKMILNITLKAFLIRGKSNNC